MKNTSFVKMAGLLCFVGAIVGAVGGIVTGFIPPVVSPDMYSFPYTPTGFLVAQSVFMLNHVLLLVGILALAYSDAVGSGLLGRAGVGVSVAGMAALTLCEIGAMTLATSPYPSPGTDMMDMAYGVATILIGVGMTLAGISVARAGEWGGWRRFITLACGVAVFVVVLPGVFGPFLVGRIVLTAWMLMFAALGWALFTHARTPEARPAPGAAVG